MKDRKARLKPPETATTNATISQADLDALSKENRHLKSLLREKLTAQNVLLTELLVRFS